MKLTKLLFFCFSFALFCGSALAQDIAINGKVSDEKGMPLPGVTVLVKGTSKGTASDIDGNYDLKADPNATLTFSFVGYNMASISVNGRSKIDVSMVPESENLNEVVVVGYGTQKKSVVTGSISSVRAKDIENLPVTRIEQTLQGRISGVVIASNSGQPGSASTMRIRGVTTFGDAGNNPLFVVDGVVVDTGGIGYLNQSDIESIEVLKDASAAAIYGTRGAAGVVLVTTKKGKAGKMVISYNGYTGSSAPARKLDLLNATQYATLRNEAYANGYTGAPGGFQLPYANPESFGKGTDWQDVIFNENAQRQSHEVSMSGGNDTSTFYLSFGLLDQEGIVATDISHYNRKNIRLNSNHKFAKWLTVGQTIGFSRTKTTGIGNTNNEYGGPLASAINLDPITPVVVTDPAVASQSPYTLSGVIRDENGNPYGISNTVAQEMSNPRAYIQTRLGNYDWADDFVGNAFVEIEPVKGLKLKSSFGAKQAYYGSYSFTPSYYLNASTINAQNSIFKSNNQVFGWNIENTISYTGSIKGHNFTVLVGQGAYKDHGDDIQGTTFKGIPVNNYHDASFNFDIPQDQKTTYAYKNPSRRISSLFARINYDYKEKYLLTAIVRRDGSTQFGSDKKYGNFPSFSAGWVPTKEAFWKENDILTQLKLKGGFGVTGNDNFDSFKYLSLVNGGRNYTIGSTGAVTIGNSPDAPANKTLHWEETKQTNLGFEATFFKNLNLSVEWYNKKTTGILRPVTLPGYNGVTGQPWGNVADLENKGVDIEMNFRKTIGGVKVYASGNVSFLKNKVLAIDLDKKYIDGPTIQSSNYPIARTEVGQSIMSFYGFTNMGVFQNQAEIDSYVNSAGQVIQPNAVPGDFKWKDRDDNGVIDDKDRSFIGNPLPDVTYGITLSLEYKNFDLLIFGQGVAGNQIYQGLRRLDISTANYSSEALDRWTGEGSTNSYPRLSTSDSNHNFSNPSNFYLEDGDYFRFKTIQLGYSLPSNVINKIKLQRVRLYVTGENLITFTKYSGFDPEIGGEVMGIDRGYYPQAKSYMFGLNLQF